MDRRKFLTGVAGGAAAAEVGLKVFSVFDVHGKDRLMELLTVNANHRPHCEIEVLSTSKQGRQTGEWRDQKQLFLEVKRLDRVDVHRAYVAFFDNFGFEPKELTITKYDLHRCHDIPFVKQYDDALGFLKPIYVSGRDDKSLRQHVQYAISFAADIPVRVLDVPDCSIVRLCG